MMINTHKIIGQNILTYANSKSVYLINDYRFIWGNIKPDCASKYKLMKHYFDESIDVMVDKIIKLASLSLGDIYYKISIGKFSEEIGVVCHFLCDYFCAPHYYRWEFKNTIQVKNHMVYEKDLGKIAKEFKPTGIITSNVTVDNVKEFILDLQEQYKGSLDYKNDLTYSYYVCDSIVNMILNNVLFNESTSGRVV
ncbi:zinc dependent phospholipase C family protein [Clostridium sp. CTA-5]